MKEEKEIKTPEVTDLKVAKKLVAIATSAFDRGIEFDLSFASCKKVMTRKTCYFTGVKLTNTHLDPNQCTFDRVDNNKGYIDGNVVACSQEFNSRKGNITVEDVQLMMKAFKKLKIIK